MKLSTKEIKVEREELIQLLWGGIYSAEDVVAAWAEGDLAGAVNALEGWAEEARELLE